MPRTAVVFLPGIMGTELKHNGELIWPPTLRDVLTGYDKIEELKSADVEVGGLVMQVTRCYSVYRTIIQEFGRLGVREDSADRRLVPFPYDWRRDLFDTADRLAETVRAVSDDGFDTIHIVAHSMGGLVARLMLEGGAHDNEAWFGKISSLITLATPHLGAPLAIARALGLQEALGIPADEFPGLAGHPDYPAAYQLFPPPGDNAVWGRDDPSLAPVDVYDPAVAARLNLEPRNILRAKAMHDVLGKAARPDHVRYFYFAGTGQKTVTRINAAFNGDGSLNPTRTVMTETADGGDGTVPLYSALPHIGQRQIVTNEHVSVFTGRAFQLVFARLMGVDLGPALEAAPPALQLSANAQVFEVGTAVQLVLVDVNGAGEETPIGAIAGEIVIQRFTTEGEPEESEPQRIPVRYSGPKLARFTFLLAAESAGLYRVHYEDDARASTDTTFAVREPTAK